MSPGAAERAQAEIVVALADPGFYPHRPERVEHLQTHISHVFLAGPFVYKLKKAVRFSFLDFGTVERRRFFCEEEVRLNARLSPEVYLGVVAVTREHDGRLALGGRGPAVAHLVWMRTLPAERRLVSLVERGALDATILDRLAVRLAAFHASAPSGSEVARYADPEALRVRCAETVAGLAPYVGRALSAAAHEILADFGPCFIQRHETLLRMRQIGGRVCEGHGDLHAEHVYHLDRPLPGGHDLPPLAAGIYLVDCLEFSQPLRCNDVAAEVAFLTMDLERLGRRDLAERFLVAYTVAADDPVVRLLASFYGYQRACVRGLVAMLKSDESEVGAAEREDAVSAARRYLALAGRYAWGAGAPVVIACSGLSGSGKSALADALADATGFPIVSTDVLRKARRLRPASYTHAARDAVYQRLYREVDGALARGRSVIADATFLRRAHREQLRRAGRARGRAVIFVDCQASEDVIRRRLASRAASALSDARWETYVAQRAERESPGTDEPVVAVATDGDLEVACAAALRVLWPWFQGRPLPGARA